MKKTKKQRFFEELMKHYTDFATNITPTIKQFAAIKKKFPKEVELLRNFQKNGSTYFTEGLTYEEKGRFYELMLRCNDLVKKFQIFYELSCEELKQLEKDLMDLQKRSSLK